ncbi:probable acetyl xylan esterase AxeA [hydrothermal vent metagenome]|uniref:Probable acetyl xylan esterase AxeA n=1 Tax=hydrothermal vent metagenome TaxID=652676 RepID=A0A3B0T7F8_9ZZZZ
MIKKRCLIFILVFSISCNKEREKHVYLLIGQSNMAGRGAIETIDITPHKNVFMFTRNKQWVLAKEPMHFARPERIGVGPGFAFGRKMAKNYPNADIYLIPCAVGATSIQKWERGAYHKTTQIYPYDSAMSVTKEALKVGELKGILWHQGESDSKPKRSAKYEERLKELMQRIRTELNADSVPIVVGELGRFHAKRRPYADSINEIINRVPQFIPFTAVVSSETLTDRNDSTHFDSKSYRKLGKRYANKMIELQKKRSDFFYRH